MHEFEMSDRRRRERAPPLTLHLGTSHGSAT
jgi:hypothetical protein